MLNEKAPVECRAEGACFADGCNLNRSKVRSVSCPFGKLISEWSGERPRMYTFVVVTVAYIGQILVVRISSFLFATLERESKCKLVLIFPFEMRSRHADFYIAPGCSFFSWLLFVSSYLPVFYILFHCFMHPLIEKYFSKINNIKVYFTAYFPSNLSKF